MILNSIDRNIEDMKCTFHVLYPQTQLETQYKLSISKVHYELNLGNDARI